MALPPDIPRGKDAEKGPAGNQDAVNFGQDRVEIFGVLHHLVVDHKLEGSVGKRDAAIDDRLDRGAPQRGGLGLLARAGACIEYVDAANVEARRVPRPPGRRRRIRNRGWRCAPGRRRNGRRNRAQIGWSRPCRAMPIGPPPAFEPAFFVPGRRAKPGGKPEALPPADRAARDHRAVHVAATRSRSKRATACARRPGPCARGPRRKTASRAIASPGRPGRGADRTRAAVEDASRTPPRRWPRRASRCKAASISAMGRPSNEGRENQRVGRVHESGHVVHTSQKASIHRQFPRQGAKFSLLRPLACNQQDRPRAAPRTLEEGWGNPSSTCSRPAPAIRRRNRRRGGGARLRAVAGPKTAVSTPFGMTRSFARRTACAPACRSAAARLTATTKSVSGSVTA